MRYAWLVCGVLTTACRVFAAQDVPAHLSPILTRDIDKRPLPKIAMADLSPAMQREVKSLIDEARANETQEDKNRAAQPSLETTVYRIPVAPKGHRLYYVQQDGELACAVNGPNCEYAVYDETDAGVAQIVEDSGTAVAVVRRPNLQMPDIAAYEQLGHVSTIVTVYRYDGKTWNPYLCKETSLQENGDPNPSILANKSCS